jgi:hypothetical protein
MRSISYPSHCGEPSNDPGTQYGSLMVTDAAIRVAIAAVTVAVGWAGSSSTTSIRANSSGRRRNSSGRTDSHNDG